MAIYCKETQQDIVKGVLLLQSGLQDAVDKIDDEGAEQFSDTNTLMGLIAQNLAKWKREINGEANPATGAVVEQAYQAATPKEVAFEEMMRQDTPEFQNDAAIIVNGRISDVSLTEEGAEQQQ